MSIWYFTPQTGPSFEVSPSKPTYTSPLRALAANDRSPDHDTFLTHVDEDDLSQSIYNNHTASPTSTISQTSFDIHGRKVEKTEAAPSAYECSMNTRDPTHSQNLLAALFSAVKRNNVEGIKETIAQGAPVNLRKGDSTTALGLAVQLRHYPAIHVLLELKADCQLPILEFVKRGDVSGLMYLQGIGASLSSDIMEEPLLHQAAKYERLDMVQYLLSQGLDAEAADADGRAAIYYACERGCAPIVKLLLDRSSTSYFNDSTSGLLHLAAWEDNYNTADLLLQYGYPIDAINAQGYTALNYAVMRGHLRMVQILLHYGAIVGHSLHRAGKQGDLNILSLLVERCNNIDLLDNKGMTALDYAIDANILRCVAVLLSHGARTTRKWPGNRLSILHRAVTECAPLITAALVTNAGAPVNEKDTSGQTVLDHAVLAGDWQLVKLLVGLGADSSAYYHFDDLPNSLY